MNGSTMPHLDEALVNDFVDARLDAATHRRVAEHVGGCDRCARDVADTQAVVAWGRAAAPAHAPAELWPLIAASTMHVGALRRQVLRSMRGLLIAGALVLIAATALVTWKIATWEHYTMTDAQRRAAARAARPPQPPPAPLAPAAPGQQQKHAGHPDRP